MITLDILSRIKTQDEIQLKSSSVLLQHFPQLLILILKDYLEFDDSNDLPTLRFFHSYRRFGITYCMPEIKFSAPIKNTCIQIYKKKQKSNKVKYHCSTSVKGIHSPRAAQ